MHADPDQITLPARRLPLWAWCALLAILVLGGVLRFAHPDVIEYRRDEANLSRLALSMARGESVPLLGIGSSIGAPNPPFSVWVFVPPYLFGNDPTLATQWVGLLSLLAVLLTFLFTRRWFGTAAALIAAGLFACGPWPVIFARKIWAQDVLPFFIVLTIGTGVLGFLERKAWARLLFLPLLSITGQIHYGTFVLIPAAVYLIWCGRKHLDRSFWIGAGITVVSIVPFVVGALQAWNALPEGKAKAHLEAHASERDVHLSADVLLRMRDGIGGSGATTFVGGEMRDRVLDGAPDGEVAFEILGWIGLLGCAYLIVRALRGGEHAQLLRVLALWLVMTPLVYSCTWTKAWIHYMIPILPVAFIACALLLRDVTRRVGGRALPAIGVALLVALGAVQVWDQMAMMGWVGENATPGGFGVPLGRRLAVREDIPASATPELITLLYIRGAGTDVVEDGEAAVWDVLLSGDGREVRFLRDPSVIFFTGMSMSYGCGGPGRVHEMRPHPDTGVPELCFRVMSR